MKEAEEYAQDMAMYYESAHGSIPSQFEKYLRKAVEYGYGKANEWHKLRKNPNDLPDNKRSVWCYYGDGCGKGHYDEDKKGWIIEGHLYCSSITAWRELPEPPKE